METFLVTGGAGFIGSAVIRYLIEHTNVRVVNVDKLTYAGNLNSLQTIANSDRYYFEQVDITNSTELKRIFKKYQPTKIMHLAAESHVDRSIDGPSAFIDTNIIGTYQLLECARTYFQALQGQAKSGFRFHHISTDEVFGDLPLHAEPFNEQARYEPSSPYSASKASSDHLVRAWHRTYGLPVIVTNCTNNYGPFQFPEKLIPLTILNAKAGKKLPVYGNGEQIRDWLYVEDHASALFQVVSNGTVGETYNIGGDNQVKNIDVVRSICASLEALLPEKPPALAQYTDLIEFVTDRPGHDVRYGLDIKKVSRDLNWQPRTRFEQGLHDTVNWYLNNEWWWQPILDKNYQLERLGKGEAK